MRGWLPSIAFQRDCICLDDGEAEGWLLSVEWRGLFVEVSIARRVRTLP